MIRRLRLLVAALAVTVGVGVALGATPAAAAADCPATYGYGPRICFDPTTGYGPIIYVYYPGNTIQAVIPVTAYGTSQIKPQVRSGNTWGNAGVEGVVINGVLTVADYVIASGVYAGSYYGTPVMNTNDANAIAILRWYGGGGYENMPWIFTS